MTIYCPSCGKPNTDQADKCASCGKELEKSKPAGSKFKGTMMMSGVTPPKPGGQPGGPAGAPGPQQPTPAPGPEQGAAQQGGAEGGAPQGGAPAPEAQRNLAFQQTMLGPMTPPGGPATPGAPGGAAPPDKPKMPSFPPASAGPPSSPGTTPSPGPQGPAQPGAPGTPQPPPPAGGGFGAGPGAPGQPAQPQPAQPGAWGQGQAPAPPGQPGGWGQGPAQPGQPGGWGGAPPAQPGQPGGMSSSNKKLILWIALGCVGLVVLACAATGIFVVLKMRETAHEVTSSSQSFAAQATRVPLGFALTGIERKCQTAGAAQTAQFFYPKAFPALQSQACDVDDRVIDAFADPNKSKASVLSHSDLKGKATALGLDPDSCFLYEVGEAKIIGCTVKDGFKIIDLENLKSL